MKLTFIVLLFAASAFAQKDYPTTAACGPESTSFKVDFEHTTHKVEPPESGNSVVYFIHEAGASLGLFAYPTTKMGVDGAWVGANHGNSYFSVALEPGEHHLCAALQSSLVDQRVELAHLHAEAGQTYFYRTRLVVSHELELLNFEPLDSDQGNYLIGFYSLSRSHPSK